MKRNLPVVFAALITIFFAADSDAFMLKCRVNDSYHFMTGGYLVMECREKKTGTTFYSESLEAGPGLRFVKYNDDGTVVNKNLILTCPFMRAKKLQRMKSGEHMIVAGPLADLDVFFGGRVGLSFGRPGVCITTGYSSYEFGVELGIGILHLYKN